MSARSCGRPTARLFRISVSRAMKSTATGPKGWRTRVSHASLNDTPVSSVRMSMRRGGERVRADDEEANVSGDEGAQEIDEVLVHRETRREGARDPRSAATPRGCAPPRGSPSSTANRHDRAPPWCDTGGPACVVRDSGHRLRCDRRPRRRHYATRPSGALDTASLFPREPLQVAFDPAVGRGSGEFPDDAGKRGVMRVSPSAKMHRRTTEMPSDWKCARCSSIWASHRGGACAAHGVGCRRPRATIAVLRP